MCRICLKNRSSLTSMLTHFPHKQLQQVRLDAIDVMQIDYWLQGHFSTGWFRAGAANSLGSSSESVTVWQCND